VQQPKSCPEQARAEEKHRLMQSNQARIVIDRGACGSSPDLLMERRKLGARVGLVQQRAARKPLAAVVSDPAQEKSKARHSYWALEAARTNIVRLAVPGIRDWLWST
jgi:hypothetical protein